MSWRDGCAPRPPVHELADAVEFDFGAADAVGQRLDGLRRRLDEGLSARATAQSRLVDWAGGHRRSYDDHRRAQEAIITGADVAAQIARLRTAWDEAAAAQGSRNRTAADAATTPGSPVPR